MCQSLTLCDGEPTKSEKELLKMRNNSPFEGTDGEQLKKWEERQLPNPGHGLVHFRQSGLGVR